MFYPPFIVVPMPLDEDGNGPEIDATKTVKMTWEVWDAACQTVSTHDSPVDAENARARASNSLSEDWKLNS